MGKPDLKVIPLGGLGEIGKNMMLLQYGNDIMVIDAGVMFPGEQLPGVDFIIPDISHLLENRNKVRGIVITHGHEDHIGALPYVLRQLNVPVYAPRLAEGLISLKLKEHRDLKETEIRLVEPGEQIRLGAFNVKMFRVCHSIPDAMGLAISTPIGTVVHSGDFKFDHTPIDGRPSDFATLAELGSKGVLLLLSDSTYSELPGYTPSERDIDDSLDRIIGKAKGRVIVATFASLIARVQQIVDIALKHNRKVCVEGRSMVESVKMASKLGYLNIPEGTLINLEQLRTLPHEKVVIIITGTQGEPSSALARMANKEHKHLEVISSDTVIMSATPIPGNHLLINNIIDNLFRQGANVLYDKIEKVHVHGHASQEELKMMINLTKPQYFVPVHGEYRHLVLHAELAHSVGIPKDNTFVMENGEVLELGPDRGRILSRIPAAPVFVDGHESWDMNSVVMEDRRALAKNGVVVVALAVDKSTGRLATLPNIVTHGFIGTEDVTDMVEASREVLSKAFIGNALNGSSRELSNTVKDLLNKFYARETKRRPLILPVTLEV